MHLLMAVRSLVAHRHAYAVVSFFAAGFFTTSAVIACRVKRDTRSSIAMHSPNLVAGPQMCAKTADETLRSVEHTANL